MKISIISPIAMGRILLLIIFFASSIALSNNSALADTVKSNTINTVKQAAQEVIKDTGVKEQFGQTENGDRLLDNAQKKANQKLSNIADKAASNDELPPSKKLFLDNLTDKN